MKKLTALIFVMVSCKSFVFTGNEFLSINNAWVLTNNGCNRQPVTIMTMKNYKPVFYLRTEGMSIEVEKMKETPCGEYEGVDKYGIKYTIRFDNDINHRTVYINAGMDHITISTKQICKP